LKATARVSQRAAMDGFNQEPNMSLAKALVVFLVLHVVAVGGIYTFNSIKAHNIAVESPTPHAAKDPAPAPSASAAARTIASTVKPSAAPHAIVEEQPRVIPKNTPRPSQETVRATPAPVAKVAAETPAVKPSVAKSVDGVKDSGALYTVAKGDNPVAIAKKLHVSYDALLKLNKISDPKKLQIGQKLHVPAKTKAES
jgi:2',3'-cyclic-nucleotide 2'-phosphodiesterase/3'-nucleotidase